MPEEQERRQERAGEDNSRHDTWLNVLEDAFINPFFFPAEMRSGKKGSRRYIPVRHLFAIPFSPNRAAMGERHTAGSANTAQVENRTSNRGRSEFFRFRDTILFYRGSVKLSSRVIRAGCAALPILLVWPVALIAQTGASISGTVRDPSGAPVSGATVTARNLESGKERTAVTNDSGAYKILGLLVGPQQVTAAKKGFTTAVRNGIQLQVGQQAVVDLKLQVGELSQQIVVMEQTPVVNTTTSPVSGVVTEREVKD